MSLVKKYKVLEPLVAPKEEDIAVTEILQAMRKEDGEPVIYKRIKFKEKHDLDLDTLEIGGLDGYNAIRNQMRQEPVVLRQLQSNRYVVDLLDFKEDFNRNQLTMVLEKVKGQSLQDEVREHGPLSYPDFLRFAYHLTEAVGSIHQRRLIHRDLTFTNVFIQRKQGQVHMIKLLDFGLVYRQSFGIKHRLALTNYFPPPEAIGKAHKKIYPTYDIYSVGVLLYYALTGEFPYPKPFLKTKADEDSYQPITRKDVPAAIVNIIQKCVRYEMSDRPKSLTKDVKPVIWNLMKKEGIRVS